LIKKDSTEVLKLALLVANDKIDLDYNLIVSGISIDGKNNLKTCTVSPVNKYCAYAKHMRDITQGESGYEVISLKELVVANYLSYVSPAPNYDGKCP
jgi:hypothetical protein